MPRSQLNICISHQNKKCRGQSLPCTLSRQHRWSPLSLSLFDHPSPPILLSDLAESPPPSAARRRLCPGTETRHACPGGVLFLPRCCCTAPSFGAPSLVAALASKKKGQEGRGAGGGQMRPPPAAAVAGKNKAAVTVNGESASFFANNAQKLI